MSEVGNSRTRWRVECAYDGASFSGWQSQANGRGIQDCIEGRLAELFKTDIRIHGSGRTDAGVHAKGQVFHFDAEWRHGAGRLQIAMKAGLPRTIQIKRIAAAKPDFHARFSAVGKRYSYRVIEGDTDPFIRPYVWCWERPGRLDVDAMRAAAELLKGNHDFSAFSADNGTEVENAVRDLRRLDILTRGRTVKFVFEANGFLYKMVRSLTGALMAVGEGRLVVADLERLRQARHRTREVPTAPAQGLFLERVFYDSGRGS